MNNTGDIELQLIELVKLEDLPIQYREPATLPVRRMTKDEIKEIYGK